MNLKPQVIPAIQKTEVWDESHLFSLSSTQCTLAMPTSDARLLRAARACFPAVEACESGQEQFILTTASVSNFTPTWHKAPIDAYVLQVDEKGILLYAPTARGLFYGIGTIRKLMALYGGQLPFCRCEDWADTAVRSEYLEMRNYYPHFAHVLSYLHQMAEMHSNALILELEDKRPFPKQPFLQAKNALTQVQIQQLTEVATENFIELIPLQQSFSHLEYVLKYPCYSHLRELENTIGEICPQNPDSVALSTALLESAAEVFPKSIYLHLGSDEVWSIGSCERCKKTGLTNGELMIQYVNQLIDIACKLGKKPLIWCDMFLNCTKEELTKLDKRVIAVVWMYDGNDLCYQASKMIDMFIEAGLCVWGGCSVRCWDKSGEQNYPLLGNRKANILAWGKLIQKYALEGIVNTNWSAYSALASPYGVYETSFYPCFFAASCAWNRAESSQAFLGRYLRQFHGVEDISFLSEGWQFEDYYRLLPRLHAQLKRGQEMCTLMEAVAEYECVTKENFPASLQLFRITIYPDREEEWDSMRQRFPHTFSRLKAVKPVFKKALLFYLPEGAADEYLAARYTVWELFEKEILRLAKLYHQSGFEAILTKNEAIGDRLCDVK